MQGSAKAARKARTWPPARFWVAIVLMAVQIRFLEKASAISAGGMAGIGIAVSHFTGVTVGMVMLLMKLVVLLVVWRFGGRRLAFWTMVAGVGSALLLWGLELIPFTPVPTPIAFAIIMVFAYMPTSLFLSGGYSTGGFSALAQLLEGSGVPAGVTIGVLNAGALLLMFLAFGSVSGLLSLVATLSSGPATQLWLRLLRSDNKKPPEGRGAQG